MEDLLSYCLLSKPPDNMASPSPLALGLLAMISVVALQCFSRRAAACSRRRPCTLALGTVRDAAPCAT